MKRSIFIVLSAVAMMFCTPQSITTEGHAEVERIAEVQPTNLTSGVARTLITCDNLPTDIIVTEEPIEEVVEEIIEEEIPEPVSSTSFNVPVDGCFKSWMTWDINDKNRFNTDSNQYKLQLVAETGKYGIRTVDKRYCIAVGSAYSSTIGQYIDVVLENGTVLECVLGDQKDDNDTDVTNQFHNKDGSVVEFIVDSEELNPDARYHGNMSKADESFAGAIKEIIVYDKYASY